MDPDALAAGWDLVKRLGPVGARPLLEGHVGADLRGVRVAANGPVGERLTRSSAGATVVPMEGRAAWLPRIAVSLLVGVLVAVGPGALAVTRWDPRYDADIDVWWTRKRTVVIVGAPDRLRIKVIVTLGNDWSMSVYLDTRGDRSADYRMRQFETFGHSRCNLWRLPNGDPAPSRAIATTSRAPTTSSSRGSGGASRDRGSSLTRSSGGTCTRIT